MGHQLDPGIEPPTIVFCRGTFRPAHEVQIPISDRGFLFGDGVYETLRTYGRIPFHLDEHIHRLRRSAAALHIDPDLPDASVGQIVTAGIQQIPEGEVSVRLLLTRGSDGFTYAVPQAARPQLYGFFSPLPAIPARSIGVSVLTLEEEKPLRFAGVKLMNAVPSILARHHAQSRGAYEVLRTNRDGRVIEGFISNVFAVISGTIATPPPTEGLLEGVTRSAVLTIARNWGVPVEERPISRTELLAADEVFLSHTSAGVVPVGEIDGTPIAGKKVGDITGKLVQWFAALPQRPAGLESAS
jgi:D-amino acid aminotransferase